MKKLKKYIEKNPNSIYILAFLFFLIPHILFPTLTGDDIFYKEITSKTLFEFISLRYTTWTSRIVIESLIYIFSLLPKVFWIFVNNALLISIAYNIAYLFTKNGLKEKICSIIVLLCFPVYLFGETGWYATSINYLWPAALALFAIYPIKNIFENEKISWGGGIFYLACTIIACNQEQCSALLLGFYVLTMIYFAFQKKKQTFLFVQLGIIIFSIFFSLFCPGNTLRFASEITSWYPNYVNFNVFQKIMVALNRNFALLNLGKNILYILLIVLIWNSFRKKDTFWKVMSLIPITFLLVISIFPTFCMNLIPEFSKFYSQVLTFSQMIPNVSLFSRLNLLISFFAIVSIIVTLLCLYKIFDKKLLKFLCPILFLAGTCTVLMMGLSPTVYASGYRTYTFYNVLLMILILLIILEKKDKNDIIILTIVGALQFFMLCLV